MNPALFKTFSFILLGVAAIQVTGEYFDHATVRYIFKPLLMPVLGVGLYKAFNQQQNKFGNFILTGLFFAWFGDIFLMFEDHEGFFIAGLVSFLITHIFYCLAYYEVWKKNLRETIAFKRPLFFLPFLIFWISLIYILGPHLEDMLVPVIFYSIIITLMSVLALNNLGFMGKRAFTLIFTGCLLFMFSDTIIAFNKFYTEIPLSNVIIMTTYILAQFLIAKGSLLFYTEKQIT